MSDNRDNKKRIHDRKKARPGQRQMLGDFTAALDATVAESNQEGRRKKKRNTGAAKRKAKKLAQRGAQS